jgi:hypothetical protein
MARVVGIAITVLKRASQDKGVATSRNNAGKRPAMRRSMGTPGKKAQRCSWEYPSFAMAVKWKASHRNREDVKDGKAEGARRV